MTNAIAELYENYRFELCNYLKRRCGAGLPEAEDVVHQAFANLVALREPALVENPRAYLYRASYHILIDERRRRASWHRGVAPELAGGDANADELTPERVLLGKERLEILSRAIHKLPHERRRSLLLKRLEGLSCAEIARRDGYSESAVKKHITQAMAELDAALVTSEPPRERSTRARTFAASLAAFVAAAAVFFAARSPTYTEHYVTDVAEVREIALPDGSHMTLGGHSRAEVHFDGDRRQVALREGEAFFSVASDADRPFYVFVGSNVVRVVGTQFEVQRGDAQVRIGVLEGVVEVAPQAEAKSASADATRVLTAGQGVSASLQGELQATRATDAAAAGEWRKGRRVYIDAPLREIVADINRYSRRPIEIADPPLGDLQLSISFRVSQPQQMLGSLEIALPVLVDRHDPGRIVLRAKPGGGGGT